ncbi:EAL domain-containing protein [Butyrivibrio sp. YAB3001]|uniref:EAL domain-containing protein n=1 Tax=Butyrivibrio sp. YAB3001 TaxID=1520812 RepID=UPI0008F67899|nr:EAL domain-containing protein [Butyrivibrio sp. YAB3001]SFC28175.1 diguanylate cyclase (GGDEF) domain-containing protein [Butyrivibrio sp. YAB3001]
MTVMKNIKFYTVFFVCIFTLVFWGITSGAETGNEGTDVLVIGVPSDRCPVFYLDPDTKETVGIGVDLMRAAAEEAGYSASFKVITEKTNKEALDNQEYDIIMPFGSAIKSSSGKESIVTENLIQTPFTMVTKDNKQIPAINEIHIGMLSSLAGGAETVKQLYPGITITLYDSMSECVKALRYGEVDALMHNSYVWSYVLQKPSYSDLKVQPTTMFSMDFRAGTLDTPEGKELVDRLNSGIEKLSDTRKQAIVLDYTSRRLYQFDFWDYVYEYRFILIAGTLFFVLFIIGIVHKQRAMHRKQEEKIRELKERDPLTGVLNLEGFKKRVEELLLTHPENQYLISFSNIKNFKFINESMGRETGDELLRFFVQRSTATFSDEEAMGRITGDRFAVLRKFTDLEQMSRDEKEVFEPLKNYFIDRGKEIQLQICTGVYAITSEDCKNIDVDRMLDYARMAEKKVRETLKTGYEFYNPEQWEKGKQILDISGHLQAALQADEIQVWYQPQVDYVTGIISGAEALCRWKHATRGWISPGVFIPVLEETGLIFDLDSFVWDKVCQDLHRWNQEGKRRSVSVNLSRSDIREDRNIVGIFYDLIQKYDINPDQLRIEITETAYVEKTDYLIKTTSELREYGFQVEMDDFGSGYSSLHMLKEVPVDRIKMDLHFLTGAGDMEKGRIIITQVIKLVELLGMKMIAEGVETKAQADFLKERGCREMQGYYFYKPMPVGEFEKVWDS